MTVRQVAAAYPDCRAVLERYGEPAERQPFGHLEPLDHFARRRGLNPNRLLNELALAAGVPVDEVPAAARLVHRPFLTAALVVTLTLGAGWGAWLLFDIGAASRFDAVSPAAVVAHGEAQLWGFVGLFILGVALRWLPMAVGRTPWPAAGWLILAALLLGVGGGFAWSLDPVRWPWLGPASAGGLVAGAVGYAVVAVRLVGRSAAAGWARFVLTAAVWLVVWAAAVAYLRWVHALAGPGVFAERTRLLLIELGVFGVALNSVYGFGLRLLPGILGGTLARGPAEAGFWVHNAALLALVALPSDGPAGFRAAALAVLAGAAVLYVLGLGRLVRVRRFSPRPEQGHPLLPRYAQLAFFWLLAGTAMVAGAEVYAALTGGTAPHALVGAARHALTVGFLTTLILGVGQRMIPVLGHTTLAWPRLVAPTLVLIGVGNAWRVVSETAAVAWPGAVAWMAPSAVLELAALALFTANALRTLWPPRDPLCSRDRAALGTSVAGLLAAYPELEDELIASGVGYLARVRTVPSELTLGTLLTSKGYPVAPTLERINTFLARHTRAGEVEPAGPACEEVRP
jgi:hypothetical protein